MTMPTFDLTTGDAGVVILNDFKSKHPNCAVYVDGALVASGDGEFDTTHPAILLSQHLAKVQGLAWREYSVHASWQLKYRDIPESLAMYDDETVKAYRDTTPESFLDYFGAPLIPQNPDEELSLVVKAYLLSGGAAEHYDHWHTKWRDYRQCFSQRFQPEIDEFNARYRKAEAERSAIARAWRFGEWTEQRELLQAHLNGYLLEIRDADKAMDPVAARARGKA